MVEAPRQIKSTVSKTGDVTLAVAPRADIDFRKIQSILWRGKTTIMRSTAVSLVLGLLFVLFVPHQFKAVTEILIEPTDLRAVANELTPANQAER